MYHEVKDFTPAKFENGFKKILHLENKVFY